VISVVGFSISVWRENKVFEDFNLVQGGHGLEGGALGALTTCWRANAMIRFAFYAREHTAKLSFYFAKCIGEVIAVKEIVELGVIEAI
jgi:hypothetical protein